jgi:hypothetical protein
LKSILTGLTGGGLTGRDVARHRWSIPIRWWDLFLTVRCRSEGWRWRGTEEAHRRVKVRRGRPGGRRRACSGVDCRRWSGVRCSANDGELESLVVDGWCFPRRRLGAAGDDGGFDGRRWVRKTTRKSGGKLSLDVPKTGEKVRRFEREGGGWTASESTNFSGVCTVSGDEIEQPGGQNREEEGRRRERGWGAL